MRETMSGAAGRAGPALLLAVSLLAQGVGAAKAQDASDTCSQRYHASLGRIAAAEYQALKSAGTTPGAQEAADPALPGNLLFPPVSAGQRTREETAALRFAASLARGKGRTGGGTDAAWMAGRLRDALGDYLTQSSSPYLCSGVKDYVAELRGDARRLGPPPIQRDALVAAQKSVVQRSVAAALAAMRPAPVPGDKPAATPPTLAPTAAPDDLRPAAGIERVDTTLATGSTAAAPKEDPDLPALKPVVPETFDTPADLVRAVDRLTAAASAGGFLQIVPGALPAGGAPAIPATTYPVLARLAEARPIVTGVRPAVGDRKVRLSLATALSAIETLDYLMRARTTVQDPVASAMDATFEAILKAHASDCTCKD